MTWRGRDEHGSGYGGTLRGLVSWIITPVGGSGRGRRGNFPHRPSPGPPRRPRVGPRVPPSRPEAQPVNPSPPGWHPPLPLPNWDGRYEVPRDPYSSDANIYDPGLWWRDYYDLDDEELETAEPPPMPDPDIFRIPTAEWLEDATSAFVGTPPDTVPPPVVLPKVIPWIARIFGPLGYIFWPSETAEDDVITNPELLPVPSRGPTRRPRVRTPVKRDAPERVRPPTVGTHPIPTDQPVEVPEPTPERQPQPAPAPSTLPRPIPSSWPTPTTWPTPAPLPAPPTAAPAWLPFLPLAPLLFSTPGRTPGRLPRPRPGANPNPISQPTPLTQFQPQPVPLRSRDCVETKPKPRKKREPRTECYRGTYTERRNGLIKRRREKIRCQ